VDLGPKKDQGRIYLLVYLFNGAFELPHRETPKNLVQKIEKNRFWIFVVFFVKTQQGPFTKYF
jgi:hypothetical protein